MSSTDAEYTRRLQHLSGKRWKHLVPNPYKWNVRRVAKGRVLDVGCGIGKLGTALTALGRTDLQIVQGDLPPHAAQVVPGHQAVGRVVAIGEDVTDWRVGDRGATTWLAPTASGRVTTVPDSRAA